MVKLLMSSVLLVGLGNMGKKYLSKLTALGLKPALCDRDESLREQLKGFPFYCLHTKVEKTPEITFIVVNPEYHTEIARYFLRKGSYVFLEKPPALSSKEFKTLLEEFGNEKLGVSEIERYSYAVRGLGKVKPLKLKIKRLNPRRGYINPLWDIGWHDFYLLLHLFGDFEIENLQRRGKFFYTLSGRLKDGTPFEYSLAWEHKGETERKWEIETPGGLLVLDFLNERRTLNGKVLAERKEGDKLSEMIRDVLAGRYDKNSALRALRVLEKLEGIKERFGI